MSRAREDGPGPELKPCPFCGNDECAGWHKYAKYGWIYYIECEVCGARTKAFGQKDKQDPNDGSGVWADPGYKAAKDAWNRRAKI